MIISVINRKGGVGKTTTAVHLAQYLHKEKGKTLLVDRDVSECSLVWSMMGKGFDFPVLKAEDAAPVAKDYEYIVIDGEASPTNDELTAIGKISDLVIIPTTCAPISVKTTIEMLKHYQFKKYAVLLTHCKPNMKPIEFAQTIFKTLGHRVLEQRVRSYTVYDNAQSKGVTVDMIKNDSARNAWADYAFVAEEIL